MAKRIMVVEDNDLNRKLFCDVLKVNGHEVVPVADGQNVLSTAAKFQPDLVIMDIQLPNVSGVELIAGRGELIDSQVGMAAHQIRATLPGGSERILDADVVLISTGASPRILKGAEPDGERILNWRQLYDLGALPDHLIVVGSGVTGAEFVSAYTEMGVKVTAVSSRDRVLPSDGDDIMLLGAFRFLARGVSARDGEPDPDPLHRRRGRIRRRTRLHPCHGPSLGPAARRLRHPEAADPPE